MDCQAKLTWMSGHPDDICTSCGNSTHPISRYSLHQIKNPLKIMYPQTAYLMQNAKHKIEFHTCTKIQLTSNLPKLLAIITVHVLIRNSWIICFWTYWVKLLSKVLCVNILEGSWTLLLVLPRKLLIKTQPYLQWHFFILIMSALSMNHQTPKHYFVCAVARNST